MNFFDIYKKTYADVMNNPSVTFLLVLFLIISGLFSAQMLISGTLIVALLFSFCAFLTCLCFFSGWSQILKVISSKKTNEEENYFPIFLEGIGKNIASVGIASFIYVVIMVCVFFITGKIANSAFGSLDFLVKDLAVIAQDNKALMEYFNKLSNEQQFTIYSWQLSFIFASMLYNFVLLFYLPAIIFEDCKNIFLRPVIALKKAILFLFKNFFAALFIYLGFYFTYVLFAILKVKFSSNILISVLLLFFYIYFLSFVVMLIFNYYEQRNNSSDRCDSIRENESINQIGEEN